jgi:DNA-binding beta-propeller fold protein YncE
MFKTGTSLKRGLKLLPAAVAIAGVFAFTGTVSGAEPNVTFETTLPPKTASFDISFVKNQIGKYILADRTNNAVDLFNASAVPPTFAGGIGSGGFVGPGPTPRRGPNGVLIDNNNNVWAGDGPGSACTTAACRCESNGTPITTSMVKEYTLAVSSGATGRLACLDTGGNGRADEMAFDPRNDLLLVANDIDNFLSLIKTSGTPKIVDQFFYADNDVGKPASARGLSTPGGGIEQSVWDPQQGFFYQALPQGSTVGRVDVFNPKPGKLVLLRTINVPDCTNGPSGLAINNSDELLGACDNGVALIDANSGKVTILPKSSTIGGGDEIWFDPGSNAWYVSHTDGGQLGVVSNSPGNPIKVVTCSSSGACGHSIAVFTASSTKSVIFDPNVDGSGISVFTATP